ncbi:MAG: PEGA domain-containing protein [Methanoregula sp.]|nr:PEGA domain-containing protein [Methanoregula sp.]
MQKVLVLFLFVCVVLVGCASADVTVNADANATAAATTAPQLIGGDMGTYLVKANVEGANVTFDNDFKGVIANGSLKVDIYTTGTPYKVISVEKTGYAVYTANITEHPAKNETVELNVVLVPLSTANTNATAQQANVTAPAPAGVNATVTAEVTTPAASATTVPATTKAGSLPFAAFAAFVVLGIVALRSRR